MDGGRQHSANRPPIGRPTESGNNGCLLCPRQQATNNGGQDEDIVQPPIRASGSTTETKSAVAIWPYGIRGPECRGKPNQACPCYTSNTLTPSSESTPSPSTSAPTCTAWPSSGQVFAWSIAALPQLGTMIIARARDCSATDACLTNRMRTSRCRGSRASRRGPIPGGCYRFWLHCLCS